MVLQIIFLLILIGFNAFFASSEIAIISLNDNKLRIVADRGNKKAKLLIDLISEPSKFLATIQVGITLSGLLASAFAAESFADRFSGYLKTLNLPVDESIIKVASLIVITIVLSYITLVFGELVPKRIAMQKSEPIAMFAIRPLSLLLKVAKPFVRFLTFSTNFMVRMFGINPSANEESVTEEEIRMMVDLGEERGVIHRTEGEMIDNIFEFNNTVVERIMTHRRDIVALPDNSTLNEVLEVVNTEKYTRFPVYKESVDNIIGILHVKDLLSLIKDNPKDSFDLANIIRKPYFIPESKIIDKLFKEMQKNKMHMVVVIDEYGGTAGIVTVEDLLEEIVGNILDEYDDEIKEIEKIDENTFMLDGIIELDTVNKFFKIQLPDEDYDTLSGFIVGQLGRIPIEGERPEVEFNGLVFKVQEVDEKRISKVKVCKT